MLFGLFLTTLSFPAVSFGQNSISGKIINGPSSSTQDIPSRWVTMDKHELFPAGITSSDTQTNSSETYSFSYSGGPFFSFDEIDVYVNPGLNANPQWDSGCIGSSDITLLQNYVNGVSTLTNLQLVAADVDIDGDVDNVDLNMLDAVVLGNVDDFTNSIAVGGTTYYDRTIVYPTTAEVASLSSPFGLTYTYNYTDPNIPAGSNTGRNFYSIRLGDLTGNCGTYNGFQSGGGENSYGQFRDERSLDKPVNKETYLYPNPTVSFLSIQTGKVISKVNILDISGRVLSSNVNKIGGNKIVLSGEPILSLVPGIYLAKVLFADHTESTRRFVKK